MLKFTIHVLAAQCVRACPTDVLEMVQWDGCAGQIASSPRVEDCVAVKMRLLSYRFKCSSIFRCRNN
jgi:hypothetical protein